MHQHGDVEPTTVRYGSSVRGPAVGQSSTSLSSRHLPVPPQNPPPQEDTKRWHDWSYSGFQFIQTGPSRVTQLQWRVKWFFRTSFTNVNPMHVSQESINFTHKSKKKKVSLSLHNRGSPLRRPFLPQLL